MSKAAIGAMADDFKRGDIYAITTDVLTVGTMLTAVNGLKNTAKNVTTKLRAPKVGSVVDDVAKGASGAGSLKLPKATELTMTETVSNHATDIIKKGVNAGELSRPYVDSKGTNLLIQEIMDSGIPVKDASLPNGLRWDVSGSFNGRGQGIWELVVDLDTNKIVHFNFTK
ncbi:hypothetical protein [Enterococcus plantarum]|nr:hypothetical protein [Enterococcus plantarum]